MRQENSRQAESNYLGNSRGEEPTVAQNIFGMAIRTIRSIIDPEPISVTMTTDMAATPLDGAKPSKIREWARKEGLDVRERGCLPHRVMLAYNEDLMLNRA